MYGYSLSGAETADSWFANKTNRPIPFGFTQSAIPSLLFGSLISATDPGVCVDKIAVKYIFHYRALWCIQMCPLFHCLFAFSKTVTVLAIFHDPHVDHDIFSLVFGESVMNDAVALVLYR